MCRHNMIESECEMCSHIKDKIENHKGILPHGVKPRKLVKIGGLFKKVEKV